MELSKEFTDSTQVKKAEYNPATEELDLTFVKGAVYCYSKFPADAWESLLAAKSIGTFLNMNIKGKYEFVKVNS